MRDYEKITAILSDLYDIDEFNKHGFESCPAYSEDMDDAEYAKAYTEYYMGMHDDAPVTEECATATMGNVNGMGAVSPTAMPGAVPGTTGTTGSGDVGAGGGMNRNIRSRDSELPRSRRKQQVKAAAKKMKKAPFTPATNKPAATDVTTTPTKGGSNIKSFSDFTK